jgi:hypothetical protein
MLDYEAMQRRADAIRAEIEAAVLALGKTQTVGNVRATFSAGRRTFDYQAAIVAAEAAGALEPGSLGQWEVDDIDYFEAVQAAIQDGIFDSAYLIPYTTTKVDWMAAVKALGLEAPVLEQKPASVTVKLLA